MSADPRLKSFEMKTRIMSLFKNGVIVEGKTELQAKVAQRAGACAIVVLDKIADASAKMPDPSHVKSIADAVALPIIGRVRVGHRTEAQIMESSGANIIEESTMLAGGDDTTRIDQSKMIRPCIASATDLASIVHAIHKGAAAVVIGAKGGAASGRSMGMSFFGGGGGGGGPPSNAVNIAGSYTKMKKELVDLLKLKADADSHVPPAEQGYQYKNDNPKKKYEDKMNAMFQKFDEDKECRELALKLAKAGKFPVLVFAYSFTPMPADIALLKRHGYDGIYLENKIFDTNANPMKYINNIVKAMANSKKNPVLLKISDEMGREGSK